MQSETVREQRAIGGGFVSQVSVGKMVAMVEFMKFETFPETFD